MLSITGGCNIHYQNRKVTVFLYSKKEGHIYIYYWLVGRAMSWDLTRRIGVMLIIGIRFRAIWHQSWYLLQLVMWDMIKAKTQILKETRILINFNNNFVFQEQYSHLIALSVHYVHKKLNLEKNLLHFRKKLAKLIQFLVCMWRQFKVLKL